MDPLSVTAGVVGIVVPALHGIRLLTDDIQKISDAPLTVQSLIGDLRAVRDTISSLEAVTKAEWDSLGNPVIIQSEHSIKLCLDSCDRFRSSLSTWTRHSEPGKLSWRDKTALGFFKKNQVKSMSEQLQSCKITLASVASAATLHSTLQQNRATMNVIGMMESNETQVSEAIEAIDKQMSEVNRKLSALVLQNPEDRAEAQTDRATAISQVAVEQTALGGSRELLTELLAGIERAATNARGRSDNINIQFGEGNQGSQTAINHGTIRNEFNSRR